MVDSQTVQNRRVQIVDMDWVTHNVVTVFVGFAVADAGFDTAAG